MQPLTIIALSKTKLIKLFIGALSFIALGILFIARPFLFIRSDDPYMIKIIGYISIAFFGFCAVYLGMKIFDKKPGLIIDAEGFTDNSSGASAGKVLWKDVKEISVQEVMNQKFIMLKMKNPELYLQREKNPIKKRMMELNYKLYQTPVNITANGLKIGFESLYELINEKSKQSLS